MNSWSFTGYLSKDAEVRQAGNSTVCNFSVPVRSGYGQNEQTTWVRCAIWGKKAEGGLPQYLKKGTQVGVTGEVTNRDYEHEGMKKTSLEVRVVELDLLGGGQQGQSNDMQIATDNDSVPF